MVLPSSFGTIFCSTTITAEAVDYPAVPVPADGGVVALHIFILIFFFAYLASAWNLVALAGQLDRGQLDGHRSGALDDDRDRDRDPHVAHALGRLGLLPEAELDELALAGRREALEPDGVDGVGQMQINPQVGLSFATGLRAILRQDPDVVMVGEIRDLETAQIAYRGISSRSAADVQLDHFVAVHGRSVLDRRANFGALRTAARGREPGCVRIFI